jgi:hypothetical protein
MGATKKDFDDTVAIRKLKFPLGEAPADTADPTSSEELVTLR